MDKNLFMERENPVFQAHGRAHGFQWNDVESEGKEKLK